MIAELIMILTDMQVPVSLFIVDKDEVWIMELIGKGEGEKGSVGCFISSGWNDYGHANQELLYISTKR